MLSTAFAATPNASRYLQQLCKHWSHKLDVEFDPNAGRIVFTGGDVLTLAAAADGLRLELETPPESDAARMRQVVDDHLKRFAFREELEIAWS